jgi:hypothetical protein
VSAADCVFILYSSSRYNIRFSVTDGSGKSLPVCSGTVCNNLGFPVVYCWFQYGDLDEVALATVIKPGGQVFKWGAIETQTFSNLLRTCLRIGYPIFNRCILAPFLIVAIVATK